jgi:hypothetical protein
MRSLSFVVAAALVAIACGTSEETYNRAIDEARACMPGDTCVLAGGGACTCPAAVNGREATRLNDLGRDVRCADAGVQCPALMNPRCEHNVCVADRP